MPGSITSGATVYPSISLKGDIPALAGVAVEEKSRPGVDGHEFRQFARRHEPFELVYLVDCDSLAAAHTRYAALAALRGSLVTVTDDKGVTAAGVMLLDVVGKQIRPTVAAAGGVSTLKKALLAVTLRLQLRS